MFESINFINQDPEEKTFYPAYTMSLSATKLDRKDLLGQSGNLLNILFKFHKNSNKNEIIK